MKSTRDVSTRQTEVQSRQRGFIPPPVLMAGLVAWLPMLAHLWRWSVRHAKNKETNQHGGMCKALVAFVSGNGGVGRDKGLGDVEASPSLRHPLCVPWGRACDPVDELCTKGGQGQGQTG